MAPMINMTIRVPEGTTNHGQENLICSPAEWTDYLAFFFINYIAHSFTLMRLPGETMREIIVAGVCALFVPGSGMIRALRWIFSHASTESDPLREALRAGAVCMVVKGGNVEPQNREKWAKAIFKDQSMRLVPVDRSVHGGCTWPKDGGYYLAEVPPGIQDRLVGVGTMIEAKIPRRRRMLFLFPWRVPSSGTKVHSGIDLSNLELPRQWNFFKALVGLFQTLYAAYTLYKAMGDQINKYGMTAFGLTVTPYAFMSITNSIASLFTPEYPSMFLIETPDMIDARRSGGHFGGAIARLDTEHAVQSDSKVPLDFLNNENWKTWIYRILLGVLVLVPLIITGGLSHFRIIKDRESLSRNVWILLWLIAGSISSFWIRLVQEIGTEVWGDKREAIGPWYKPSKNLFSWLRGYVLFVSLLWIPAVGGMVQVGLMMKSYGSCVKLTFNPLG